MNYPGFVVQYLSVLPLFYCLRKLGIPLPKTIAIAYNLLYPIYQRDFELDLWNAQAMMLRLVLTLIIIGLDLGNDYSFIGLMRSVIGYGKSAKSEVKQIKTPLKPSKLEAQAIKFTFANMLYLLMELLIKYAIYCAILIYQKDHYPSLNPIPRKIGTLEETLNIYSLGIAMSFLMEVIFAFGMFPLCFLTNSPYFRLMKNPYLSTSVSDFWSSRWNLLFQHFYYAYPYKMLLDKICGTGGKTYWIKLGKPTLINRLIATLGTFMISGAIHEYICCILLTNYKQNITLEQLIFFTLNGVFVILEAAARKLFKNYGIDISQIIPTWIKIVYANVVVGSTGYLFMNPFIRDRIYFKLWFVAGVSPP